MQMSKTTMTEPFIWRPPLKNPRDKSRALYRPGLRIPDKIGQELALSQFNGVVWKQDGVWLHRLSQIPDLGSLIRSVKFNLTRTDRGMFQEALAEIKDPQKWAEAENLYLSTQGEATEPLPFPRKLVAAALKNLPNLESVTLTWVECPWKKHMAVDGPSFEEESLARAGNEVFKTQQTIIEALRERNLPLKSLTLEPFMPRCVLALSSFDPAVSTVFGSITELTLKLDYGVAVFKPDYLEHFVSLMPNIRRLSIHAWPVDVETSGIDLCTMKRLRYLESIDFSCLKFKYDTLANFFSHHGSTIKQIKLNDLFLWREPAGKRSLGWDDMFLSMKKRLTALEGIWISGTFTDDAGQHQVFFRYDDPGEDTRNGSRSSDTDESTSLEDYVLEKVERFTHPQPEWRAYHHRNAKKRPWAPPTPPPENY